MTGSSSSTTRRGVPCGAGTLVRMFISVLAALFTAIGCTSYPEVNPPQERPHVDVSQLTMRSDDSSAELQGKVITLPGQVEAALYDRDSGILLVRFSSGEGVRRRGQEQSRYAAVDLSTREVLWSAEGEPELLALRDSVAALGFVKRNSPKARLVDAFSGEYIGGDCSSVWFGEEAGRAIAENFTDGRMMHSASYVDLRTKQVLWQRPLCDYVRKVSIQGGCFYSVGLNCLDAISLKDGNRWSLSTPTSNSGEAFAKNIFVGALGAAVAVVSPITCMPGPSVFEHHFALPLVIGDRVYFAGREAFFCLSRETGEEVWKADLSQDHGSMRIVEFDDAVLLVASGWMLKSGFVVDGPQPLVVKVSGHTGERLATFIPESAADEFVTGIRSVGDKLYMLTTEHLYRLGPDLELERTLAATDRDGWFLRFISDDGPLLIRTQHGVIEVGLSDLSVGWREDLRGVPEDVFRPGSPIASDKILDVVTMRWYSAEADESASSYLEGILWLWSGDSLYAIDASTSRPGRTKRVTRFPLAGPIKSGECVGRTALACVGPRVVVAQLDARVGGDHR